MTLQQLLLSSMPPKVQCSKEKRANYLKNIPKTVALDNYKFIQLFNNKYINFISIDIDQKDRVVYESISDVVTDVYTKGLPIPTLVVKTDNGYHIHWYLEKSVFKNNKKDMFRYTSITDYFNKTLNGDKHFAKFIVRNPLKHEYFFTGELYVLDDFKEFSKEYKPQTKKGNVYRTKNIVWGNVEVGERNKALYSYLRDFMFINFTKLELKHFEKEALRVNFLMPTPLVKYEVLEVTKSVYNWVKKNYNPNYVSENRVEYNRSLAKNKQDKTLNKIKDNLIKYYNNIAVLKLMLGKYTIYGLSKILKVDRKTVKKYLNFIKEIIKMFLLSIKDTSSYVFNALQRLYTKLEELVLLTSDEFTLTNKNKVRFINDS